MICCWACGRLAWGCCLGCHVPMCLDCQEEGYCGVCLALPKHKRHALPPARQVLAQGRPWSAQDALCELNRKTEEIRMR